MRSTGESLDPRRAAGVVLRRGRQAGVSLANLHSSQRPALLRPALAIQAILAAMRAQFELSLESAAALLAPALADRRDAVGCADELLIPADAARDPALVPLPMPSWCVHLLEAGALLLDGRPLLEGGRVLQRAWLLAIADPQSAEVECFPFLFAGRAAAKASPAQLHLAVSPPFLSDAWTGPILLRAAASRDGAALPVWLGPPASPGEAGSGTAPGASGPGSVTWAVDPTRTPRSPELAASWPRWMVLRILEGDQPQGLWDLQALILSRTSSAKPGAPSLPAVSLRLAVDLGSTTSVVLEEDGAPAAVGGKLLASGEAPSGFLRLAGEARSAHRHGCGQKLLTRGGQLPTMLCASSAEALSKVLRGESGPEQLWLAQAGEEGGAPISADRFKSPELLLHSDWLAAVSDPPALEEVSRRLFHAYAFLLGRTLAAAHATPFATSAGGTWALRAPRLGDAEAVLTFAPGAWSADSAESFRGVLDAAGAELCRGLRAAWAKASHRLVSDPAAARAARQGPTDRQQIEVVADLGGLTLQIAVRVPSAPGRPPPLIAGTSMRYLLGGERLVDAAAYAAASLAGGELRESYRARSRMLRASIAAGRPSPGRAEAVALRDRVLEMLLSLVRRQVEGTLRRAAPDLAGLRGAGIRLLLLGEGWKLFALEAPDAEREAVALERLRARIASEPLVAGADFFLERIDKRKLCAGALRKSIEEDDPGAPIEIQGIDTRDGQRFFGLAQSATELRPAPQPGDPWWREFTGGVEESLLRVEQWFGQEAPFASRLAGGHCSFLPRQSLLRQWLDLSGPSLIALRIRESLRPDAPAAAD